VIPCACGHTQTDDGHCEVLIGKEVHEIPHDGHVCRLCGRDIRELEPRRNAEGGRYDAATPPVRARRGRRSG
jgi:hypothetical protein